jgi:SAM-dependent methyltransferase
MVIWSLRGPAVNFLDYFSAQASEYAKFRPGYPEAMFSYFGDIAPDRELAWDCATGNGQAAISLAGEFETVIATDASEKQIANAFPHERIQYRIAKGEDSGLHDSSISALTIANALHWLDIPRFMAEARRVLKPNGIFAIWCCNKSLVDEDVTDVVRKYNREILGPYWSDRIELVEHGYQTVDFPFQEIASPEFVGESLWDLEQYLGYLNTWSAAKTFAENKGYNPIDEIRETLESAWGPVKQKRKVRWPMELRVGRKIEE